MDSLEGDLNLKDYEDKIVFLDLEFLFNVFLREGASINMRVRQGIPEGANALMAGISDGSLVVIFDRKVPDGIIFEDFSNKIHKADLN